MVNVCNSAPSRLVFPLSLSFCPRSSFPIVDEMDLTLHCNTLKCRAPLSDQAVVTTCRYGMRVSHCVGSILCMQPYLLSSLRQQSRFDRSSRRHSNLSSMRYTPHESRRCSPYHPLSVRRLQDQRSQRPLTQRHHGMRDSWHGLLPVPDNAGDVSICWLQRSSTLTMPAHIRSTWPEP